MNVQRYDHFVTRQTEKVERSRELERFRRRLRWWALTLTLATVVFTVILVVGELT